jgi:hypothetical protein
MPEAFKIPSMEKANGNAVNKQIIQISKEKIKKDEEDVQQ